MNTLLLKYLLYKYIIYFCIIASKNVFDTCFRLSNTLLLSTVTFYFRASSSNGRGRISVVFLGVVFVRAFRIKNER